MAAAQPPVSDYPAEIFHQVPKGRKQPRNDVASTTPDQFYTPPNDVFITCYTEKNTTLDRGDS
jgi:hypothetical protein